MPKKRGRKPTGKTPVRQVGRISKESWSIIRRGFDVSGDKNFTTWAEKALKAEANRELKKFKKSNRSIKKLLNQSQL